MLNILADFRFELRNFLHFSESVAVKAGLEPQQHQLLLQVAGAPAGALVTITYAAQRLRLQHNSAVELVNRSVREGLLLRTSDAGDRRRVILQLTRKGQRVLDSLTAEHARELSELAPRLALALKRIREYTLRANVTEAQ
jgi:DNA-binding MarR family transcriptional regulator